jgi:hopene-associated glycosyltransferase HpnB
MTPLEILALLPLAFWLGLLLDRRRGWPRECCLSEVPADLETDPAAVAGTAVTAVVPARDEAAVLPETLPALLSQEAPGVELRVVLVDDGSTDGTADAATEAALKIALGDRLRILRAPPTPPAWTGKVHALACGVREATMARAKDEGAGSSEPSEWLLFTDADIRHRPGSLVALLTRAREGPYDLVSVMARLHAETFWERLLIPPFVFYFQLLYPFRRVRDPRSRVAAAAGGCVLVRREALAAAGGVDAIREAVIDDVSLARRVAAAGGRLWLGLDPGIVSVRPYRGLGELWRMVARSAFVQLRHRWDLLAAVLVGLAVFVVAPPFLAAAAGWELWAGVAPTASSARALVAALGAWTLEAVALWPAERHHRVPGAWAWTLPFASILYGLMTASSAWNHLRGHGARWKGRAYR